MYRKLIKTMNKNKKKMRDCLVRHLKKKNTKILFNMKSKSSKIKRHQLKVAMIIIL